MHATSNACAAHVHVRSNAGAAHVQDLVLLVLSVASELMQGRCH